MNPIAQQDRVLAGWPRDDGMHPPKNGLSRTSCAARPAPVRRRSGADPQHHPETA